jgi:hypothetical protein
MHLDTGKCVVFSHPTMHNISVALLPERSS